MNRSLPLLAPELADAIRLGVRPVIVFTDDVSEDSPFEPGTKGRIIEVSTDGSSDGSLFEFTIDRTEFEAENKQHERRRVFEPSRSVWLTTRDAGRYMTIETFEADSFMPLPWQIDSEAATR